MRHLMVTLALLLIPLGAHAQTESGETVQGFYAGAGVGSAEPTSWDNDFWYSDVDSGDSDTSLSVFAGYRFNRHLAAEVGWFDGGTMGWEQSLVYVPELLDVYNTDLDLELTAVNVTVIGILPFARIWEAYLRGGAAFYDANADGLLTPSFGGATFERSVDDSGAGFLFGMGIGVTLFERFHVLLEYQSLLIDEDLIAVEEDAASVDTFLLGVQYRFGI